MGEENPVKIRYVCGKETTLEVAGYNVWIGRCGECGRSFVLTAFTVLKFSEILTYIRCERVKSQKRIKVRDVLKSIKSVFRRGCGTESR